MHPKFPVKPPNEEEWKEESGFGRGGEEVFIDKACWG